MSNSRRLMTAFSGSEHYWIALLGGTGSDVSYGCAVAADGSVFFAGATDSDGAGGFDGLVAKYNSSGVLQWDRTLGGSGTEFLESGAAVDSAGNVIVGGLNGSEASGGFNTILAKYNSSGALQWQRAMIGANIDRFAAIVVDSADSIICVGNTESDGAGGADALIAKYNSSGALQWVRTLGGASSDGFLGVTVDSADNIVCVGQTQSDGAGGFDALIAKYNSSGVLQWDRTLGGSGTDRFSGVAIDGSGNIICVGETFSDGAGNADALIAKYNSSGTLQWDRTLGGTGSERFNSVAMDSADNIFCAGNVASDGAGGTDGLIAKYNSSGTLQWNRTLGGTGAEFLYNVRLPVDGVMVLAGFTGSDGAGSNDCMTARLPSDGSLTGTYGSLVYQDAVLTDDPAVLTDAVAVLTDAVAVIADAPATLTDALAVLTDELIEVS